MKTNVVITGAAGFIGFHLAKKLLNCNVSVIGIDNINSYYDIRLKEERLNILSNFENFTFHRVDIKDYSLLRKVFETYSISHVVNLAAQAGVRYSIENPFAYVDSNLVGFMNVLEVCKTFKIKHLLYASSSSVYGGNEIVPFSTNHNVDHPKSLYAATKKCNELLAHSYSHLYNIPTTGLRFFTVYGPLGRPDMAYFSFVKNIIEDKSIDVFNYGKMMRDFTYVDDIVEGIYRLIDKIPEANTNWKESTHQISESFAPYKIYNIGNSNPVKLMDFISTIEKHVGKKAIIKFKDMQAGDVHTTFADVSDLETSINFKPITTIDEGIGKFVNWYKVFYNYKLKEKLK